MAKIKNELTEAKIHKEYPEIDDIRQDLDSLKNNVVELTRHVQANGIERANILTERAREQVKHLQERGYAEIQKVERRVKDYPAQSLAVAFGAGLIASMFLRRR